VDVRGSNRAAVIATTSPSRGSILASNNFAVN
jgi:hypothetical protein